MAFKIHTLRQQQEAEQMSGWKADRRLWLTVERDRVVEDGDPEAAFLLCSPGVELTAAEVARYDLGPRKAEEPPAEKAAARAEDKAAAPPANKGRSRA